MKNIDVNMLNEVLTLTKTGHYAAARDVMGRFLRANRESLIDGSDALMELLLTADSGIVKVKEDSFYELYTAYRKLGDTVTPMLACEVVRHIEKAIEMINPKPNNGESACE